MNSGAEITLHEDDDGKSYSIKFHCPPIIKKEVNLIHLVLLM